MEPNEKRKNHEKKVSGNGGLGTVQSSTKGSKQPIFSKEEIKTTRRKVIKQELYSSEYIADLRSTSV
jgi:hypothetical protein